MTKKVDKKKLSLRRARLRTLDAPSLEGVQGGGHKQQDPYSNDCVWGVATSMRAQGATNHNQALRR